MIYDFSNRCLKFERQIRIQVDLLVHESRFRNMCTMALMNICVYAAPTGTCGLLHHEFMEAENVPLSAALSLEVTPSTVGTTKSLPAQRQLIFVKSVFCRTLRSGQGQLSEPLMTMLDKDFCHLTTDNSLWTRSEMCNNDGNRLTG